MKKSIIITAIILFAVSAFAQKPSRERTRSEADKKKSETAVRRSADQTKSSRSQHATRTRQATARDISHANRTRTQSRSRSATNPSHKRSGNTRSRYNKPDRRNNYSNNNKQAYRGTNSRNTPTAMKQTEHRKHYNTPNRQAVRMNHSKGNQYHPVKYRKVNYHYRSPKRVHVTWNKRMYYDYRAMYPEFRHWYYPIGYQIVTIPTYNAYYHIGEVRNIYGRVHEIYYSWQTDEYHLYFGGTYPYHDFTVVISGNHARRFARSPEMYFEGRYMWVTGLVSTFEGRPELIVKRRSQIHLY